MPEEEERTAYKPRKELFSADRQVCILLMSSHDSQMESQLVSIITVVFNGEAHLQEAIDSVRAQSYSPIEYIIIDGGSSDKTLEIINSNSDIISRWVSEPDNGIYDAMNKGIRMASGTYIGLLNADDLLMPDAVQRVVEGLEALCEPGYTCGAVELVDQAGRRRGTRTPLPQELRFKRRFIEMPCPHLGVFVHRSVYQRVGVFDTQLKLSADYDFVLRLLGANVPVICILEPLGKFRSGGASGGLATWLESYQVLKKHGISRPVATYIFFRSLLRANVARLLSPTFKRLSRKFMVSKNSYE